MVMDLNNSCLNKVVEPWVSRDIDSPWVGHSAISLGTECPILHPDDIKTLYRDHGVESHSSHRVSGAEAAAGGFGTN